jgi:hypothetical protein
LLYDSGRQFGDHLPIFILYYEALLGAFDDMIVGEDVAISREDHSRSEAVLRDQADCPK